MATYDAFTRFSVEYLTLFAHTPTKGINYFDFDFAAPTGDEDANINKLLVGDLVFASGDGLVKKIKRGTAVAATDVIGVVVGIVDIDGNTYNNIGDKTFAEGNGRLFTESGKGVSVYTGNFYDYPIYANQIYIHAENAGGADTREVFDIATDGSGALAGRIKVVNNDSNRPQIILN